MQKEINLIPAAGKRLYKMKLMLLSVPAGIILLALIVSFGFIIPRERISRLKAENDRIVAEINAAGNASDSINKYQQTLNELQTKRNALAAIESDKVRILDFLKRISVYLPENVFVTSLSSTKGETFNISFVTSNVFDTLKLMTKLQEMDLFEKVELPTISLENKETIVTFSLKIKGKKPQTGGQ